MFVSAGDTILLAAVLCANALPDLWAVALCNWRLDYQHTWLYTCQVSSHLVRWQLPNTKGLSIFLPPPAPLSNLPAVLQLGMLFFPFLSFRFPKVCHRSNSNCSCAYPTSLDDSVHDAACCYNQMAFVSWEHSAQYSTAQPSTAQHSTAQHSTAQHSTAQHINVQKRSIASMAQHRCGALQKAMLLTAQCSWTGLRIHWYTILSLQGGTCDGRWISHLASYCI